MNPQDQNTLTRLTMAVKKIVYDPERFNIFLKMLGTQSGALTAVHTVLAVIGKQTQIPPQLMGQLGVNTYLVMVDVAEQVTKHKADPKIVHAVISQLMHQTNQTLKQSQQTPQQAPQQPPQNANPPLGSAGIIGSQMGAAA